jgi:hypothetical protein
MAAASLVETKRMKKTFLGGSLATTVSMMVLAIAPAAHSAPLVCNQASPHFLGGGLVALDPPVNSPAARYTVDLSKLPGKGAGLVDAAAKSPSLTVCDAGGETVVVTDPTDDGGVDIGGGIVAN